MQNNNKDNFAELFAKIEAALVDAKILRDFDSSKLAFDDVNLKTLSYLMECPFDLHIDDDNNKIFVLDINGDKIYCPEPEESVLISSDWLVDKLPSPTFSFDQGGNVRKSEEAEAIYQVVVVSRVFNNAFSDEIDSIINNGYDFENLLSKNDETFLKLLTKIQDFQSMYINAVLSACQLKISNIKKRLENFFVDMLTQEEITKLGEIDLKRKEVNVQFEKVGKGTKDLKNKTKIEVLEIINEREDAYNKIFVQYPYFSKLWKIRNLSSEYIPTISKAKIRRVCEKELSAAIKDKILGNEDWEYKEYLRRSIRKAYKAVLINIKEKEMTKCQSQKELYNVPLKR